MASISSSPGATYLLSQLPSATVLVAAMLGFYAGGLTAFFRPKACILEIKSLMALEYPIHLGLAYLFLGGRWFSLSGFIKFVTS